jgi:hypothetical protein
MKQYDLLAIVSKEGDYHEWTNTFKCYIRRNGSGAWCGYTVIPKYFPIDFEKELNINCHGSLTYQQVDDEGNLVIGFDCAHHGDLLPKYLTMGLPVSGTYRDMNFATSEVNYMVKQILDYVKSQRYSKIKQIFRKN